jgi:hypothetical protein
LHLKILWNKKYPLNQIAGANPKEIHNELSLLMPGQHESTWAKILDSDKKIMDQLDANFRPKYPKSWKKKPTEWLTNFNIETVMKQYETAYKCFTFIGPSPIDFDSPSKFVNNACVCNALCNFSIKNSINQGKTKIGIIFNTDPHNKRGEHWISLFMNLKTGMIFFYDSVGDKMPKEVSVFIKRVLNQGNRLQPPLKITVDSNEGIEHQKKNTECGMYSLFFIIQMLTDTITPNYIKTQDLPDKYMVALRKRMFVVEDK